MKHYQRLAVALALACGFGAFQASYTAWGAEVVRNDFEVNYGGWHGNADGVRLVVAPGAGLGDSRGALVSGRRSPREGAVSSKGLYLKGGEEYRYSVQVYSETKQTIALTLFCRAGGFRSAPTIATLASKEVEPGVWTELAASYTAPENVEDVSITIASDTNDDFRFDDVLIEGAAPDFDAAVNERGLKDVFASSFRVGNILNGRTINNREIAATTLQNFNSVECENETKPDSLMSRGRSNGTDVGVSLDRAAAIFEFCASRHIPMRGHTLVWHSQTPSWFFKENFDDAGAWVDPATMDARMESYIKNVFEAIKTQYPDLTLYAFDVCNECVDDDFNRIEKNGGARKPGDANVERQHSAWVQIYGDNSFVEKAFTFARKYAPEGCALYYNDYNEYMGPKRDCIYAMCKDLYEKGLLDGVGMQTHIQANAEGFGGVDAWTEAMKKYLSIGCDVQVTEMDVSLDRGKFSLEDQAKKYAALFQTAVDWNAEHPEKNRVTAMCVWGPNDANSWLQQGSDALLFDRENLPKPAYDALLSLGADQDDDN